VKVGRTCRWSGRLVCDHYRCFALLSHLWVVALRSGWLLVLFHDLSLRRPVSPLRGKNNHRCVPRVPAVSTVQGPHRSTGAVLATGSLYRCEKRDMCRARAVPCLLASPLHKGRAHEGFRRALVPGAGLRRVAGSVSGVGLRLVQFGSGLSCCLCPRTCACSDHLVILARPNDRHFCIPQVRARW